MSVPKFTVLTNLVSPESSEFVGTSWEFFTDETDAFECYERHIVLGNVPMKRPFHRSDIAYMGAAHHEQVSRELEARGSA